jgi:uncharacterized Tic20 family protein
MDSDYPFHRGEEIDHEITFSGRYGIPLVHLSLWSGALIPYGWIAGPLFFIYTIGNRHTLVHSEATKAFNFGVTVTVLAFVVHVYGILAGRTPDMTTYWTGDQLLWIASFALPVFAGMFAYFQAPFWYPAIPFVRPPKTPKESDSAA